ncbi:MAG: ATP-dependent 6-phosphofructokinase [Geminicoccaceae bacterium]|nr:MAG: ATP-dependent 6-phosphofructokinase [Geminicoccaceae bacterium]
MRIGVLTSGGDCAGLNAVIRAVVRRAVHGYGFEVYGIHKATHGFATRPVDAVKLTPGDVSGLVGRGGTVLETTNKGDPFDYPDGAGGHQDQSHLIGQGYFELGLDALIGIGGDGSLGIMDKLARQEGWNLVGIPKTIDNDLGHTEAAIGFQSAVQVATEALDRLDVTAASHSRVMVLEVMGRDAGHIALNAGIAGGAHVILIPEIAYDIEIVCQHLEERRRSGRNHSLVIVAEAAKAPEGDRRMQTLAQGEQRYGGVGQRVADAIAQRTGAETRVTVLGHVQRGGSPVAMDRVLASAFGVAAVDLCAEGKFGRMVAWQHRKVVDIPIGDAIGHYQAVDLDDCLVTTARGLGITFGDR